MLDPTKFDPDCADLNRYNATGEKFTFCLDLLELSLMYDGEIKCSKLVERLERKFDRMNHARAGTR